MICKGCDEELEGRRTRCDGCYKKYVAKYAKDNRDRIYAREKANRDKLKAELVELKGGECQDCGGVYPQCCYDFHHLDPNEKDFSIGKTSSRLAALEEIKKCIMLCANCHRKWHWRDS